MYIKKNDLIIIPSINATLIEKENGAFTHELAVKLGHCKSNKANKYIYLFVCDHFYQLDDDTPSDDVFSISDSSCDDDSGSSFTMQIKDIRFETTALDDDDYNFIVKYKLLLGERHTESY